MLKRILIFALVLTMCMTVAINAFAADDTTLAIEMNSDTLQLPAKVWDGELYLPLRAVFEGLQFDVQWFGDKQEIKVSKPGKSIELSLSEYKLSVNSHEAFITGGYQIINGRTYLRQDLFSDNAGLSVLWDKAANKVTLQEVEENPIKISTKKESSETETLKLTLQYPEISGLDNAEVQSKLNSQFARLAAEAKARGYEIEKYIGQDEISRHIKAEGYFNYNMKYNQKDLLSVVFLDYQYSGGAHGGTVQSSYTFDLNTGAEYEIKDMFKAGSDYISLVNSEVKKQMDEREMTVLLAPFESIRPEQDFYLSNSGIVVYFQEYEYLPYSYGIPEFSVDYSLVKENGGTL